jgi:uncharacterized repeat protein (TIGR01451 family)
MFRLSILGILFFTTNFVFAQNQSWNPYVVQGIISPAPLLPVEFNGMGVGTFNVGNTGGSILPLVVDDEIQMIITLSAGLPNNVDPLSALSGSGVAYFNWTYSDSLRQYTGKQNQPFPINMLESISVAYRVTENTPLNVADNGFIAVLVPPDYTIGLNSQDDDAVSSYTFVRAMDFGDAPISYGSASAEINLFKGIDGNYEFFVMLGDTIDHEMANSPSALADGDDNSSVDDEDGVIFPTLLKGANVTIPVTTKVRGSGSGSLNAWIDWNGNGYFDDVGEQIINDELVFETQVTNLLVNIPMDAVTGTTFARFRFGENVGPTGFAHYGEVEDYKITIFVNGPAVSLEKSGAWNDVNNNGRTDVGESITYTFKARNLGNTSLSMMEISDPMISNSLFAVDPPTLNPGEIGTLTAQYILTNENIENGAVYNHATVFGTDMENTVVSSVSVDPNPLDMTDEGYNESCQTCTYTKLSKGNEIIGYVWEDLNIDGILNQSEPVLSGQKIILFKLGGIKVDSTISGLDGGFRLHYIENGDYYLQFIPDVIYSFSQAQMNEPLGSKVNNLNGFGTTQSYNLSEQTILRSINAGVFLTLLPVSWVKVEVARVDGTNKLQWTVESEKDVEKYLIYRSTGEEDKFQVIGETKPLLGVEGLRKNYIYLDFDATSDGDYYYFIENVDKDDRRSKSKIVSISLIQNTIIDVFPNPASNYLNISIPHDIYGKTEISLYNANGGFIKNLKKGISTLKDNLSQFDISDLIPGKYIVKLKIGDLEIDKRIIVLK